MLMLGEKQMVQAVVVLSPLSQEDALLKLD